MGFGDCGLSLVITVASAESGTIVSVRSLTISDEDLETVNENLDTFSNETGIADGDIPYIDEENTNQVIADATQGIFSPMSLLIGLVVGVLSGCLVA